MPLKLQTPKDLHKKLQTIYNQAQHIKFKRLAEKEIENFFEEVRDCIKGLKQSSFEKWGFLLEKDLSKFL